MGAVPFRYDEESIQGRLFRYDRVTKTVEQRQGSDANTFKWVPIPRFKNLQHVRDFMAQWERNRKYEELEHKQRETESQNEKSNRNIEELKNTVETMKREQEFRDMRKR